MATVVQTYNLFLNTDDGQFDSDNYDFQLGNNSINTYSQSQFIRLTLLNFNMYKNWTDVNPYNHGLVFRTALGLVNFPVLIDDQNYSSIRDLAVNLSASVDVALTTAFPAFGAITVSNTLPLPGTGITGTTNNIIGFTLTTTNPHGITQPDTQNGNFALQAVIDPQNLPGGAPIGVTDGGDCGLLVGIDRVASTTLTSCFTITVTGPNTLVFLGVYPAQRFTEPNIYMRINPAPLTFATNTFSAPLNIIGDNLLNQSTILAEIKIDAEMIQYSPTSNIQFFGDYHQKALNHLQIRLTDSRNRTLPITGPLQTTLGNRQYTCTLRVDVLEGVAHGEIPANMAPMATRENLNRLPARFDSNVLISNVQGNGGKRFGFS